MDTDRLPTDGRLASTAGHQPPTFAAPEHARILSRRTFIADLGRGAFALALVSLAACSPSALASLTPGSSPGGDDASDPPMRTPDRSPGTSGTPGTALRWERVNLGFVSAYILARGGEAAIVDAGTSGSADQIEAALAAMGLGWSSVSHLVLTHRHGDHVGSAADVLTRAPGAAAWAGAEEIGSITVPRPLTAVGEGDRVFDLQVVTAPGHTAGSICVLDPAAGVLVVGDAMGTSGGRPTLPGAQFTDDMDEAERSIAKLGNLTFETLLVGHGDPITSGASALVAGLGRAG